LALQDDLAVAHEKLGDHEQAIELISAQLAETPDRYETHANLGTFYIHAGDFEQGLKHIDRAIEINPDAHFGRERYQRELVRYLLSRKTDGKTSFPLNPAERKFRGRAGFATHLWNDEVEEVAPEDVKKAIQGVLGMMRFGNYDSPVLLEALGDLLLTGGGRENARQLAARAYLKASYEVEDKEAVQAYRKLATEALAMQLRDPGTNDPLKLPEVEKQLKKEIAAAAKFRREIATDEARWIRAGQDPEAAYQKKYYQAVRPAKSMLVPMTIFLAAAAVVLSIFLFFRRRITGHRQG